jgi:predicted phosphodiesterase
MQIAILSDIHGNSLALDAVLDDIKTRGDADAYWILGDLVAMGPDPVGVLERLNELPNAIFVRGNTDRYVLNGANIGMAVDAITGNQASAHTVLSVQASISFAQGALIASGWTNWLASIGLDHRVNLPDGTRALLVHASPETDDGTGIHPGVDDAQLSAMLTDCEADLVCVGHSHVAFERVSGAIRVLNPGSLSVPWADDVRAKYAMLSAQTAGYTIEPRSVAYDVGAVMAQLDRLKHPGRDMLLPRFRGEVAPPWQR